MSTKTNKYGVKAPVLPRGKGGAVVHVSGHSRSRPLSETVAKKAAKHKIAFRKLART